MTVDDKQAFIGLQNIPHEGDDKKASIPMVRCASSSFATISQESR